MSTIAPPIGSTPPVDIEAIEKRWAGVTRGEWRTFSGGGYISIGVVGPCDVVEKACGSMWPLWDRLAGAENDQEPSPASIDYHAISFAPRDVAALLAEVKALRARRTAEEERAAIVAFLRAGADRYAAAYRRRRPNEDRDYLATLMYEAQSVANSVEKGDHLQPPPAEDTTTDIRTEPSTGRVASRYEP